jgi:hypothetical protein
LAYRSNLGFQFLEYLLNILRQWTLAVLLDPGIGCEAQCAKRYRASEGESLSGSHGNE